MFSGKSFHESMAVLGATSWKESLCLIVLLFVVLIPFFGFHELRRVFGTERLVGPFLDRDIG